MYLKIIGDPKEAAKKLGTNVPLSKGQLLPTGNQGKIMAQKFPELFDLIDDKGMSYQELMRKNIKNKLEPKEEYVTKEESFAPEVKEEVKEDKPKKKKKKKLWLK